MPSRQSNRMLLNPLSTIYSNSTTSTCTTELESPAVSARILYHESFGRPATSKSLPDTEHHRQSRNSRGQQHSHHHTSSADVYPTSTPSSAGTRSSDSSSWHLGKNNSHCSRFGKTMTKASSNNNNNNNNKRHKSAHMPMGMTGPITTEEEFDALPIAVRRKFFSTLERLRFAQSASTTNEANIREPETASYQSSRPRTHSSSIAERRGLARVSLIHTGRRGAFVPINRPKRRFRKSTPSPLPLTPDEFAPDSPRTWFKTLPEKIQQSQFSREEQIALAGGLREGRGGRGRESVILDAADEAIYKASCQRRGIRSRSEGPSRPVHSPSPPSLRSSMDSLHMESDMETTNDGSRDESDIINAYDPFRWLDEESELDLRLDDYHANLPGSFLHSPTSSGRRPSFRRRISISKLPFGGSRNSVSVPGSPIREHWAAPPTRNHEAKRSRTLSLVPGSRQSSTAATLVEGHQDPNACYYQDPDARLKLRVYLASPQKFDEAIEFGFPSLERDRVRTPLSGKENQSPFGPRKDSKDSWRNKLGVGVDGTGATFLNDDDEMVFGEDDDMSMDPDSPKTPLEMGDTYNNLGRHRSLTSNNNSHIRFASKGSSSSGSARASRERNSEERDYSHLGITKPTLHKRAETDGFLSSASSSSEARTNYMQQQIGPGNREMTLRMTLTRPDLRTDVPPNVPEKVKPVVVGTDRFSHGSVDKGAGMSIGNGSGVGAGSGTSTSTNCLGWQNAVTQTTITAGRSESDWEEKSDSVVKGPFGGPDGWGEEKTDGGVVKRFWKKVKHSKKG